ncbi:uncharacterized protein LOC119955819 [Scyliorhinus canicula]|uniref:uncharacterized protein LOC119955819 n=1 Tax=Scyliorhinus canicula TaxID=7830 RepID=UPI0018F5F381|nr:uncharacterized protein LOC119955819 [Scyliorhinus canicula]
MEQNVSCMHNEENINKSKTKEGEFYIEEYYSDMAEIFGFDDYCVSNTIEKLNTTLLKVDESNTLKEWQIIAMSDDSNLTNERPEEKDFIESTMKDSTQRALKDFTARALKDCKGRALADSRTEAMKDSRERTMQEEDYEGLLSLFDQQKDYDSLSSLVPEKEENYEGLSSLLDQQKEDYKYLPTAFVNSGKVITSSMQDVKDKSETDRSQLDCTKEHDTRRETINESIEHTSNIKSLQDNDILEK